jgi:hypothetical protein
MERERNNREMREGDKDTKGVRGRKKGNERLISERE